MTRLLCLVRLHDWRRGVWGHSEPLVLSCRECRRCGRFQIYAFGEYHNSKREFEVRFND
jgi:hypothetical protein